MAIGFLQTYFYPLDIAEITLPQAAPRKIKARRLPYLICVFDDVQSFEMASGFYNQGYAI
jgi:hypothetical protein